MKVIVEIQLETRYGEGWYASTAAVPDQNFNGKSADEAAAKVLRHVAARTLGEEDLGVAVDNWKMRFERADGLAKERYEEMHRAEDRLRETQNENRLLKERLTKMAVQP